MKIKKRHILAIFLLAFVGLNIISMSSVFLLTFKVQPSFAIDYEEEDIQQFADSDLRNVTVILDTSGGAGIRASVGTVNGLPAQFTLEQVLVRMSTLDYIPAEWKKDPLTTYSSPFLHNVFSTPEKILSFAQSRFSGGLGSSIESAGVAASIDSVSVAAGIQSMASLMEEANHTSEATGSNFVGDESFKVDDIVAETEYNVNASLAITNLTHGIGPAVVPAVESVYQAWDSWLDQNETNDFIAGTEADQKEKHNCLISGFDNTEEGVLDVLTTNVAAYYSTSSQPIDPADVTVIDYTLNHMNQTAYLAETWVDRVRDAIEEFEEEQAASAMLATYIFGIKIHQGKASPAFFGGFTTAFRSAGSRVLNIGKTIVSAPLTQIKKVGGIISRTGTNIKSSITSTGTRAYNFGRSLFRGALKAPSVISKTVGTHVKNFAGSVKTVATGAVKATVGTVTKITSKGMSVLTGGIKSLFSWIPQLLLLGCAAAAVIIVIFVIMKQRKKASPYYDYLEPY